MKEQKNDIELIKKDGQEKQPYEKPQLGAVKLFADHVLGVCKDISTGCSDSPATSP